MSGARWALALGIIAAGIALCFPAAALSLDIADRGVLTTIDKATLGALWAAWFAIEFGAICAVAAIVIWPEEELPIDTTRYFDSTSMHDIGCGK